MDNFCIHIHITYCTFICYYLLLTSSYRVLLITRRSKLNPTFYPVPGYSSQKISVFDFPVWLCEVKTPVIFSTPNQLAPKLMYYTKIKSKNMRSQRLFCGAALVLEYTFLLVLRRHFAVLDVENYSYPRERLVRLGSWGWGTRARWWETESLR